MMQFENGSCIAMSKMNNQSPPSIKSIANTKKSEYSAIQSVYRQQYDDKLSESKGINDVGCRELVERQKRKEYTCPPLPNLVNTRKAYLNQKLENKNYSVIVQSTAELDGLYGEDNNERKGNASVAEIDQERSQSKLLAADEQEGSAEPD